MFVDYCFFTWHSSVNTAVEVSKNVLMISNCHSASSFLKFKRYWRILVHEIAGFSEYILAVIELFHGNLLFFWRCEFDEHHDVEVIDTLFFNFSNP